MFPGTLTVLGMLAAGCLAHIYPSSPCMRGSPLAECNYEPKDYSLSSPIGSGGSTTAPLCHHAKAYDKPVKTYKAGDSINVVFNGGATHNGGHCEFSLSYDGGKTFVAIKTILDTCFLEGLTFNVPIPANAPSGDKVVFAWSWVNKTGNREFYMTCSDIAIQGSGSGVLEGPPMIHPNYGNGPKIGEFTNGGDNGSKYYKERQNIRVQGSGGSSAAADSSSSSSGTAMPPSSNANGASQPSSESYGASAGTTGQSGTEASAAGTAGTTSSATTGQGTAASAMGQDAAGGISSGSMEGTTVGQGTTGNSAGSPAAATTGQGAGGGGSVGSSGGDYLSAGSGATTGYGSTAGQANESTSNYGQTANPPTPGASAAVETPVAAPPAARDDSVPIAFGSPGACASGQGSGTYSDPADKVDSVPSSTEATSGSGTMDKSESAEDTSSTGSVYKTIQPLPSSEAAKTSVTSSGSKGDTESSAYSCQSSGSAAIQVRAGDKLVTIQCPQGLVCKTNEGSGPYCDHP
ncbi:hypothetical protein H4R35_005338 [Dimargaris xerosporica]|nr:hypothetical protein H4R35_005338 [Dimargaris xerosporica]